MDAAAPIELSQLLGASDPSSREAAWEDLIGRHTRLLLALSRSFGGGHDEVMVRSPPDARQVTSRCSTV